MQQNIQTAQNTASFVCFVFSSFIHPLFIQMKSVEILQEYKRVTRTLSQNPNHDAIVSLSDLFFNFFTALEHKFILHALYTSAPVLELHIVVILQKIKKEIFPHREFPSDNPEFHYQHLFALEWHKCSRLKNKKWEKKISIPLVWEYIRKPQS